MTPNKCLIYIFCSIHGIHGEYSIEILNSTICKRQHENMIINYREILEILKILKMWSTANIFRNSFDRITRHRNKLCHLCHFIVECGSFVEMSSFQSFVKGCSGIYFFYENYQKYYLSLMTQNVFWLLNLVFCCEFSAFSCCKFDRSWNRVGFDGINDTVCV